MYVLDILLLCSSKQHPPLLPIGTLWNNNNNFKYISTFWVLTKHWVSGLGLGYFVVLRFGYFQVIWVNVYHVSWIGQGESVAEH